jgi:hypothetical protein
MIMDFFFDILNFIMYSNLLCIFEIEMFILLLSLRIIYMFLIEVLCQIQDIQYDFKYFLLVCGLYFQNPLNSVLEDQFNFYGI